MEKGKEFTTKFKVDVSDLKAGISEANKQIQLANAKFKAAAAGMDDWSKSSDGISAKLKQLRDVLTQQTTKLTNYKDQLKEQEKAYSENGRRANELKAKLQELLNQGISKTSDEYKKYKNLLNQVEQEQLSNKNSIDKLNITILNQQGTVNGIQKDIRNYSNALDELENESDQAGSSVKDLSKNMEDNSSATDKLKDGFTVAKGALSSLVADGIRKGIDALKEFSVSMVNTAAEVKAEESMFEQTFGDMKDSATEAIDRVADSTGILASRLKVTGSQIYAFARSNGATVPEAMKLMEEALMASADSAAYYDKSLETSAETLQSFLKGNFANDAALGVSATEFTRNAKAAELFGKKYNDLTEIQKQQTLLKMVTDSQKAAGAMGQAAREADGWENVQGNLNETWRQFKAQVGTPFLEALVPVVKNLTSDFTEWRNSVDWNDFGKKVENTTNKIGNGFKFVVKHGTLLTGTMKAMVGAFAFSKVMKFTKSMSDYGKGLSEIAGITKMVTTATKASTVAQTANTTATTAGTVATRLFNAAWKANPIGVVVTTIIALSAGIYGLVKATQKSSEETDKNVIATDKLVKKQKELNKELKENEKTRKSNVTTANEEAGTLQFLFDKLSSLNEVENKSTQQKNEMARIVSELNTLMPELNLSYDKENDALNMSTEAIRQNIEAQKDLILAKATQENLNTVAKDVAKNEMEAAKATKQHEENQKAYNKAKKELADFEKKYSKWEIANTYELGDQYAKLTAARDKTKKSYEESGKAVKGYKKTLEELNEEYENTSEAASNYLSKADIAKGMASLTEKAKEAGREIPNAISDGINSGKYAIPSSIKELDKLIAFDDALVKAGLSGKDIPRYISQGVISGKTSIKTAMKQIEEVTTLADEAQKLIDEGKAIPKNLAKGIIDGTYSIDEAKKILEDKVTYDKLKADAKEAGASIPKDLASNIKKGTISVSQANELLQESIDFQSKVNEASEAGIKIPNKLAEGIKTGELQPSEAMTRVQALIDYQKMFNDANLSGKAVPEKLKEGILNGKISIDEANNAMNSWISFKNALDKAGQTGISIPPLLANNIISGKTSVDDAVLQMNSWINFQTALDKAGLTGTQIPEKIQQGILSGKIKPAEAIKQLNSSAKTEADKLAGEVKKSGDRAGNDFLSGTDKGLNNQQKRENISKSILALGSGMNSALKKAIDAHSPSKESFKIGGFYLDGLYNGIANRDKRNSIFNSITNFGTNLLGKLKNSLKEHSPSKATNEMGQFLLDGIGLGIDKRRKDILNKVSSFGKSVLSSLQNELNQNVDLMNIKSNLQQGLTAAKSSLSNLSVPSLSSMNPSAGINNSKVNNFTQNIYAPQQPSRIEIYRQTKNLLEMAKGG